MMSLRMLFLLAVGQVLASCLAGVCRMICRLCGACPAAERDERMRAIRLAHQSALGEIDEIGDYYVRLFAYIDQRLDDEIRRRRSN